MQFKSTEEELAYLKSQFEDKKQKAENFGEHFTLTDHAEKVVSEYRGKETGEAIHSSHQISDIKKDRLLAELDPKPTDAKVAYLAQIMAEHGVKNAMDLAEGSNSPYILDDFCRYLVTLILTGHEIKNNINEQEWRALHMKLFEVMLPLKEDAQEGGSRMSKLMERFYVSMQAIAKDDANKEDNYYSLELAVSDGDTKATFYIAVHIDVAPIFEKVVLGVFPEAQVSARLNDFNIFGDTSIVSGAVAKLKSNPSLPINTYEEIEGDPIGLILSSFSKIQKNGEGLCLQVLVRPGSEMFQKSYGKILDELKKGYSLKRALEKQNAISETFRSVTTFFDSKEEKDKAEEEEKKKRNRIDDKAQQFIEKKLEATLVNTNIRIIASSATLARSEEIIRDLQASFLQFSRIDGNSFEFENRSDKDLKKLVHNFSYRVFDKNDGVPLNVTELSSLIHFPVLTKDLSSLKEGVSAQNRAPGDFVPGVVLGDNVFSGDKTLVTLGKEDRLRHLYVIGQTGTGKTRILTNLIIQDILNGDGCCFIDPHGSDIEEILACVPESRRGDIIYFDPAYTPRPMGLNMLEYDMNHPEQKTFAVNELFGIFNKLFDMKATGGPGFEQYFRNAALLVMEHPASGNTMIEISRVFSDKDFRDYKLSKTKNPLLIQFWQNAEKTTGEQGLQNWTQYVTSKFDIFLSNDIMRPIIAQETSAFNFREIMDQKKILLVNLSKGRLGDINANLIGLIIVGKFLQAALSRVDTNIRPDFYLYIDEFQNITTPAISAILSEARKYRLSLNIAHQFISQLEEDIKGAVFGNVGNMAVFRVGPDDAKYLEQHFAPTFTSADIIKQNNREAYVKMLINGNPQKPFNIRTQDTPKGDKVLADSYKADSFEKYGRPREDVEGEIFRKYEI